MTFDTRRTCNKAGNSGNNTNNTGESNGISGGGGSGQPNQANTFATAQLPPSTTPPPTTTTSTMPTSSVTTAAITTNAAATKATPTDIPNAVPIEVNHAPDKLITMFPVGKLRSLTQKISNPRWVVPVLPEQELEVLLHAAIGLTTAEVDHKCDPCMEFYRHGLTASFAKILTDDAVNSWKYNIHHCILISCGKLLQLIAIHLNRDNPYLLDLLAVVFDPDNKFNTYNSARQPECFQPPDHLWGMLDSNKMYARPPPEPKHQRGWLIDLINRFGQFGGFDNMLNRFNKGLQLMKCKENEAAEPIAEHKECEGAVQNLDESKCSEDDRLTIKLLHSFLRPFGQCSELLTPATIKTYLKPIWEVVLRLLDNLSDDELKKEMKQDGRSDYINEIIKSARLLASRLPDQMDLVRDLEMFRLNIILRLLQVSGFNGKLNALNEINKVLSTVLLNSHRSPQIAHSIQDEEMEWLTADCMAVC